MTSATSDARLSEQHRVLAALPPAVDDAALRRHGELVAGAKTGTLSNAE